MGWKILSEEQNKLRKFMKKRGINNVNQMNENQLVEFVTLRTNHMVRKMGTKKIKAYKFSNLKERLESIFKSEDSKNIGLTNYPKFKSTITKTINEIADKYYKTNLVQVKHATTVDIKTIVSIAEKLATQEWKQILTAIALLMSHYTGARMGEISELRWEDWIRKKNKIGNFWIWIVRTSKTNKIPVKREQLTYIKHPKKRLFESLFKNYWKINNKPKNGKIFPTKWFNTANINYQLKKISKEYKIEPPLSAHSGRNWAAQQLALADTDIITVNLYMRWSPNSKMLYRYRNIMLEETKSGGAFILQIPKSEGDEFEL